jgi:hypothetical protein
MFSLNSSLLSSIKETSTNIKSSIDPTSTSSPTPTPTPSPSPTPTPTRTSIIVPAKNLNFKFLSLFKNNKKVLKTIPNTPPKKIKPFKKTRHYQSMIKKIIESKNVQNVIANIKKKLNLGIINKTEKAILNELRKELSKVGL